MISLKQVKGIMQKNKIPSEIMAQLDFEASQKGNNPQPALDIIAKMDELLTKEQRLAVMEAQGCCKSGKREEDCKAFAKAHKGKTLEEKVELLKIANLQYIFPPVILKSKDLYCTEPPSLDNEVFLKMGWGGHQNGVHAGKTTCSCPAIKKLKQPFSVSSTYCGCCAGHFMYHYQIALGVKLRLKEIISSPLNTNGEQPCGFIFEVIGAGAVQG